ncbi:hypothetical protein F5Y17DRAFT_234985 [Xylariaceae sp. FL0594]|nr:hypothetical protein F5Y17DRAFT_234985 [Xylariaceae sp. FL0594]
MASSANYNHHPLPAPPGQRDQYSPYQQTQNQEYQQQPNHDYQRQSYHPQGSEYQQQQQQQQEPPLRAADPRISQQQHQQQSRTRPKSRAFSFRSDKSQKSANSNSHTHKLDLTETAAEKEAKRLHSKADPRMALNEREPAMEAQTLSERPLLRSIQHKDPYGNPITEPDRSNPTRSRWERPLDTIRAFEAAIDGGYNRKSFLRSEADMAANWNRRSSFYGTNGRPPQDGINGNGRPSRGESMMFDQRQSAMLGSSRDSYYEGFDGGPYSNGGPGMGMRNKIPRNQSEPYLNGRERNVYPIPNNHQSYETVASGSATGSMGEQTGYQTDPTSSENSSIDRRSPPKRQQPLNDYGISFGQSPSYQPPGVSLGPDRAEHPPATPRKEQGSNLRKPLKAMPGNSGSRERPEAGEKRKSWFMRRFSKNG